MPPVLTSSERRGLTDFSLALLRSVLSDYAVRGQIDIEPIQVLPCPGVAVTLRHYDVENVSRRTPSGGKRVTTIVTLQNKKKRIMTLIAMQHYYKEGEKQSWNQSNITRKGLRQPQHFDYA